MTGMGEGAIMPVKRIMNPGSGHLKLNIAWFSASQTLIRAMQRLTELCRFSGDQRERRTLA